MRTHLLIVSAIAGQLSFGQQAQLIQIAEDLVGPLDIENAGDQRLFIVEKPGYIRIIQPNGTLDPQPFLDITDRVSASLNEQGLLGMTFDPQYATNGYFYVNYINGPGFGYTRISRFTVTSDPDVADPASEVVLWTTPQPGGNHNGGDLHFGPDGYLWFALGDGGSTPASAQDMTSPLGKMLRIDVHSGSPYSVPADNPYAGSDPSVALPEIWAAGLRNPFRFSFDAMQNDLWIADVGQGAYEEIDLWDANGHTGPNFGWPCYEGPATYDVTGCGPSSAYDFPIHSHPHSDGSCSIIGGFVYRGSDIPSLYGKYIYSDFCSGVVHALSPNGSGGWSSETVVPGNGMGVSSIGKDADGELLISNTLEGTIFRLTPISAPDEVLLDAKLFLEGPLDAGSGLMDDHLRTLGDFPLSEPYSGMGLPQMAGGGGESIDPAVLATTGNNAVVDWVRVELRSAADPTLLIASRQALLQRDGDIVMADGSTSLSFGVPPGDHHVAFVHRNHLPVLTATPITLSATTTTIDMRTTTTPTYGTDARKTMGVWAALWAGDVSGDEEVSYAGTGNDRDRILLAIGGTSPTMVTSGYHVEDVNMDGMVRYTGHENDRDPILANIGGVIPTNVKPAEMP